MSEENTKSSLKLHLVVVLHEPDSAPEVVLCWDENCIEGNEAGWLDARDEALQVYGSDVQYRDVVVRATGLAELFDVPVVEGTIVED